MPKLLPVHYQTHPLTAHCGTSPLDPDVKAMIGTSDPAGVTCSRCITSPSMSGMEPVSREEYGALVRRARTSLRDAIEPLDEWIERTRAEDEAHFQRMLALDEWYRSTPWWDIITRKYIARAISRAEAGA
jgi:hypothetical protein